MPIAAYKEVLGFKIEAEAGTPEVLENANVIRVSEVQTTADLQLLERAYTDDVFTRYPHLVVGKRGTISFTVDLIGNGNSEAAAAAPWAPLLKACGMKTADDLAYTFTGDPDDYETVTLGTEHENGKFRLAGCMGSFDMSGEAQQQGKCKFTFTGIWQAPAAQAGILTPPADIVPPTVSTLSWNAAERTITRWGIGSGLAIKLLRNTSAAGFYRGWIEGRKVTATFDPEQVAGVDMWTEYHAATQRALAINVGTVAGSRIAIAAAACQITNMSDGSRDGVRIHDVTAAANGVSPLSITWS